MRKKKRTVTKGPSGRGDMQKLVHQEPLCDGVLASFSINAITFLLLRSHVHLAEPGCVCTKQTL